MSEELKKELDEAILAGERALGSLKTAYDNLTSAKNWGIFDMMGGGLIADMVKYSRMTCFFLFGNSKDGSEKISDRVERYSRL